MKTYTVNVQKNGDTFWYSDGRLHRTDGPAVERANGTKYWYLNDKLHRTDGPAAEYVNGSKYWFLNGVELTEAQFVARTKKSCEGKVVEVDGVKYRLTAV